MGKSDRSQAHPVLIPHRFLRIGRNFSVCAAPCHFATGDAGPRMSFVRRNSTTLRQSEGTFCNARRQHLHYCTVFPAPHRVVRGVVCFMHGFAEYSERFLHVYERLAQQGYGVLAYDLVGHGRSPDDHKNVRAYARRFHYFVDDTNAFLTFAKQELLPDLVANYANNQPPLILMGISFGCLVGVHTVLSEQHRFHAIVLASPSIFVDMTPLLRVQSILANPLSLMAPRARIVPIIQIEHLSRNPAFIQSYLQDPLVVKDPMTTRMGEQSMSAMVQLRKDERLWSKRSAFGKASMLILQGSHDKVTHAPSTQEFHARAGNVDKEYREFPGLYHCLFNEPEQEDVIQHTLDWLDARFRRQRSSTRTGSTRSSGSLSASERREGSPPLIKRFMGP